MFQESGISASHKVSNSELTGHLKTDNQNNSVLISTVVVSRRNANGKPLRMRARLDSRAPFYHCQHGEGPKKYSRYDYNTWFNTDPKTCDILSTTINDAVDANLHLVLKITNMLPSREINISQMRHINHLNLADPSFNLPNTVDVLLRADVVDEILLENEIQDIGLHRRDSTLGWVVSGPVAISHENCITTHLAISSEAYTDQLLSIF